MQKIIVAFDVDGTLVKNIGEDREHGVPNNNDAPIVHNVNALHILARMKNVRIVVWSGGGKQYAETWGSRLGLDASVWRYASKLEHEDIKKHGFVVAIDDIQDTAIGDINLIVREK